MSIESYSPCTHRWVMNKTGMVDNCSMCKGVFPISCHPLYSLWKAMWRRCTDMKDRSYSHYGGRGITVCDGWKDVVIFILDMGPRPEGYTLDRIDNNGNYTPQNCMWTTQGFQQNNKRSNKWYKELLVELQSEPVTAGATTSTDTDQPVAKT